MRTDYRKMNKYYSGSNSCIAQLVILTKQRNVNTRHKISEEKTPAEIVY